MKLAIKKPALSKVLSVVLPTQEQTLLLRACLWSGDSGRRAWGEWLKRVGNPIQLLRKGEGNLKGLLPLIFFALKKNGVVVEEDLRTSLSMSYLYEELRNNAYRRILKQVLSFYEYKQIPTIVLKGAALADTVYESSAFRHTGKIQILIGGLDTSSDVRSLIPPGFLPLNERYDSGFKLMMLKHNSGLPMYLHRSLFPAPYYEIPFDKLWERSEIHHIAGHPAHTLNPTDNLLHVCGDAFFSRDRWNLLWVFDSSFIINRYFNLDWNELLATARSCHLELPLSVTLGYLAEQINAQIPEPFLKSLYNSASETEAYGRAHALSIVREEIKGNYFKMFNICENWLSRTYILKWILSSPTSHLKWLRRKFRFRLFLSRYILGPLQALTGR